MADGIIRKGNVMGGSGCRMDYTYRSPFPQVKLT